MSALTISLLVLAVLGALGSIPVFLAVWRRFVSRRLSTHQMLEEIHRMLSPETPSASVDTKVLAVRA